jgi:hypothetical protein
MNDGANIHQWTCHDGPNQQWKAADLGGGVIQLAAVSSNKCLDVSGGPSAVSNGQNVHQWSCHNLDNQRFRLIDMGSGRFALRAAHSGKCLDVSGGSSVMNNGANIIQWDCHGGLNQQFTLEPVGSSTEPPDTDDDWREANLTWFESYPDPGSDECINFNGCTWAGYFAGLNGKQPEEWVAANNIAAVHSRDFAEYSGKTLRLRQGNKQIDVKVYDMCADSDCSGCCTQNSSQTGFLIDVESYTADRFGTRSGIVEWLCLDC